MKIVEQFREHGKELIELAKQTNKEYTVLSFNTVSFPVPKEIADNLGFNGEKELTRDQAESLIRAMTFQLQCEGKLDMEGNPV